MNMLMVTPHLPPYQAANAILPDLLGRGLRARGHAVDVLAFDDGLEREGVATVKRRRALRATRLPQALEAAETWWKAAPLVRRADVVHVHSSTWMNQVTARLAHRNGRPYVLTHYGTEIWHHDGKDARFRRMNREAHHVAFYSRRCSTARARSPYRFPAPPSSTRRSRTSSRRSPPRSGRRCARATTWGQDRCS